MYTKPIAGEAALKQINATVQFIFSHNTKPIAGEAALKHSKALIMWNDLNDTKPIAGEAALKLRREIEYDLLGLILNPLQAKQHWNNYIFSINVNNLVNTKPIAGEAALKPAKAPLCPLMKGDTKPIAGEAALKPTLALPPFFCLRY